jgi:type I restriction enzyme, S subunit
MTELLEKRTLNIDKSDWTPTKLFDLAEEISERADNPGQSKYDRFVGLEHFVSGDLKIKNWGSTKDLGSSMKVFQVGDVLFARRNAYLRRASLVDFDGICSGDAFVLRENNEKIVPGFLAFVLNSDALWDYANSNAAGTMSKRVKWRDLGEYEFLLPPKDQQAHLAELLWAADDVVVRSEQVFESLINLKHSVRREIFFGYDVNEINDQIKLPSDWKLKRLSDCAEVLNNLRKPISKEERDKIRGKFPYYGPTGVVDYISEYRAEGEFVLIGEDGDHFLKYSDWSMSQLVTGKFNVNNHAHIIRGKDDCLTKWLYFTFQHRNIIPYITRQGASRYKLNKESLLNIPVILPPLGEQDILVNKFEAIQNELRELKKQTLESKQLQKSLINQIF